MRVGADHLDLEARHPALAQLLERARDAVGGADAVGDSATRGGSPSRAASLSLLAALEGGRGRVGDRGDAGLEDLGGGARPVAVARRPRRSSSTRPTAACSLRSWQRRARRNSSEWLKPSACRSASSSRSGRSRSIAASQARSSARASSGPMSAAERAGARVAVGHHALDHPQHDARVGRRAGAAAAEHAHGDRHRGVRPLGGRALGAVRLDAARAQVGEELGRASRRRGACGPGAADVDAGVVVGAADADAAVGVDVDRRRAVELGRAGAVADLPDVEQLGEPAPVARGQRRRDREERVRERAGDLLLAQVLRDLLDVVRRGPAASRGRPGVMPRQRMCTACGSPAKRAVSSSETNTSGRSAIASAPSIVSWSVIVTKSMPRRLARA